MRFDFKLMVPDPAPDSGPDPDPANFQQCSSIFIVFSMIYNPNGLKVKVFMHFT